MRNTAVLMLLLSGCLDAAGLGPESAPDVYTCDTTSGRTSTVTRITSDGKDAQATGDGRYAVGDRCSCMPAEPTSLIQGPDVANQCLGEFVYRYTWVTYGECVNVGTPYAVCPKIDHVADVYIRSAWHAITEN